MEYLNGKTALTKIKLKFSLSDMTAIADLAEARVNTLYPDEHYDIHTHTFVPIEEYLNQTISNGAQSKTSFLSSLLIGSQAMPTLKELEELFKHEIEMRIAVNHTYSDAVATFPTSLTNHTATVTLLMILVSINLFLIIYLLYSWGIISFLAGLMTDFFTFLL